MKRLQIAALIIVLASAANTYASEIDQPMYQGKSLNYWVQVIRDRNEKLMQIAFDALRSMGPQAWPAVPELTKVVSEPFTAIHIGKDSDEEISSKLYDIEMRSEAIDTLATIGEAASSATTPIIDWALTIRVDPREISTKEESERFVDLVTLDAEYRAHVISEIRGLGRPAIPILTQMLRSSNSERRRVVVLVFGQDALPLASDLMKSERCGDRQLGLAIFSDVGPLVPKEYLAVMRGTLPCDAD
jgi:hypothetical protein